MLLFLALIAGGIAAPIALCESALRAGTRDAKRIIEARKRDALTP